MTIKPSSCTNRIGIHLVTDFAGTPLRAAAYLSEISMSGNAQNKRQFHVNVIDYTLDTKGRPWARSNPPPDYGLAGEHHHDNAYLQQKSGE